MTVERLSEEMSADEFNDWVHFAAIEPFGYEIEQLRAGIVASEIRNCSGRSKRAAKPADYFPRSPIADSQPRDAAYWAAARAACKAFCARQQANGTKHPGNRRAGAKGKLKPS